MKEVPATGINIEGRLRGGSVENGNPWICCIVDLVQNLTGGKE